MNRGKHTCKILKEIRQQIADKNDIEYITSECHFQGECKGTCPKCEAELRYLESELQKRKQMGKAATIAGISLGLASSFAACNSPKQDNSNISKDTITKQDTTEFSNIVGDIVAPIDTFDTKTKKNSTCKFSTSKKIISEGEIESYVAGGISEPPPEVAGIIISDPETDQICRFPEVKAAFPGGEKMLSNYLKENLKYPVIAGEIVTGRVICQFVVERDGSITQIKVIKSVDEALDNEAVRIISNMPKWKPGQVNGKDVRSTYILPIDFQLNSGK